MIKSFEDAQKMMSNSAGLDQSMKMMTEWTRNWQSLAAEMTDYTKRSFEDGTQTFEKLLSSKSLEQAVEIQSNYAKRSYDEYMHQLTKFGGMYAELAKEAYKPVERALQNVR